MVVLDTDAGQLQLALDANAWAPLQVALSIDDGPTSAAVLTALLEPLGEAFAPVVGVPIISARRRDDPPGQDAATLSAGSLLIGSLDPSIQDGVD